MNQKKPGLDRDPRQKTAGMSQKGGGSNMAKKKKAKKGGY